MDFDESLFAAAIGTAVNSDSNAAAQQTLHEALDEGAVKSDNTTMHKQAFYPTPNSSNMHATATEKQFMSPFLANYQNYPNITSENGFAELDEVRPTSGCYKESFCTDSIAAIHTHVVTCDDTDEPLSRTTDTTRGRLGKLRQEYVRPDWRSYRVH